MNEERPFSSLTYDLEADAAYVCFRTAPWDHMNIVDDRWNVDYGPDGEPNGVELLSVSDGVNLDGLPRRDVIERLLAERHIPLFAPQHLFNDPYSSRPMFVPRGGQPVRRLQQATH